MAKKQLHFAKTEIDGRCIDMLLTEDEIIKASKRVLNEKNHGTNHNYFKEYF